MAGNTKKNKEVIEDLKSIALVLGGVVIGNLMDVGAQKILKLDKNVPLSGIEEMKKFISPAVRIVGGSAGAYFTPNKEARLLLGGVAVSGAASMVNYGLNKVLKKDQAGVTGIGEIASDDPDQYHEDMVIENYDPQLPDLAIEGTIENTSSINDSSSSFLSDENLSDEEDFDEAEIM